MNGKRSKNRLLAALPEEDFQRFFSDLDDLPCPLGHLFYEPEAPIKEIYFIEDGLACILVKIANSSSVEVGMIGNEGLVGVSALLGDDISAQRIIMQIPGTALRINTGRCKEAFDQSAAMRAAVHRFLGEILSQTAQTAGCNRLHSLEQRLSRWLLMASDRARSDVMPMTQEFLSSMLGVQRTGVTDTAGALQRAGLIHYRRGQIRIIDRTALEAIACDCYRLDRDRFERLP
jgi:CRP-like cAMP-binding protein